MAGRSGGVKCSEGNHSAIRRPEPSASPRLGASILLSIADTPEHRAEWNARLVALAGRPCCIGSLYGFDLAYYQGKVFQQILERGGHFLCRVKKSASFEILAAEDRSYVGRRHTDLSEPMRGAHGLALRHAPFGPTAPGDVLRVCGALLASSRGMRTPLIVLLVGSVACVLPESHFADISDTLARRDLRCSSVIVGEYDDASWAFRAEGCGRVAYYRCSYAQDSITTQCCQRVVSEEAATVALAPTPPAPYCEDHLQ